MIDYNDGNWHGWDARVNDKCPVDERDVVEIKLSDGWQNERVAGHLEWSDKTHYPIVAFRVVEKHVHKPRVWFALVDKFDDIVEIAPSVDELDQHMDGVKCIVVREAL